MNWGPLEFGEYLRRRELEQGVAATIRAARAAAPSSSPVNRLRIVTGLPTAQACELPESLMDGSQPPAK